MLSLQRSGSNFLPYPQNLVNQHHHNHNYSTAPIMESHHNNQHHQLQDNMPWFARPVGTTGVSTPGLNSKTAYAPGGIRDKEFVTSSNPPIPITTATKMKNVTICGGRLGGGSGSSNSTLSRSISPSSAEESFLNRTNQEDSYYSFYLSNNEEEKIRSAHRFLKNVRDEELHLPEDPRSWLREDVQTWIRHMVESHGLPSVQTDRFLMNGKALCLMSMEMFCQRVPLGGKLLFKDFQLRLATAMCN